MSEPVTPEKRTVLLVDDDDARRARLLASLERSGFVTSATGDVGQAILLAEQLPALAVVALRTPIRAVDLISRIATESPDCVLVFLGGPDTTAVEMLEAMEAGVIACLLEPFDPDALPDVLEHALSDEAILPCDVVHLLVQRLSRHRVRNLIDQNSSGAALTRREWEVLELLGGGMSTRQIAERLFLAQVTVRSHIAAVLRKLDLPDRDAASDLFNNP